MEQLFSDFEKRSPTFTVSEVNRKVAGMIKSDKDFRDCWVIGEVSRVSRPTSGHLYFSLQEGNYVLKAVVCKGSLTPRIRELLTEGSAVEAHGSLTVYEVGGYYQLSIDAVRPKGKGNIYEELEKLRKKLAAEGLFAEEKKRPLPRIPRTIGVVTSPSGAALHDILNTLKNRWPLTEVWLSPASVQGEFAPPELIAALRLLYEKKPDVIILARGGGSAEDLWCFNDEALVRTVAESPVPVITGVGHEVDTTLVDYAADVRAPTPTGAAVRAVPALEDIQYELGQFGKRLDQAAEAKILQCWQGTDLLEKRLNAQSPEARISNEKRALTQLETRLQVDQRTYFDKRKNALAALEMRLLALNPENIMKRGYAFIRRGESVISSADELQSGDRIDIRFHDGERSAHVD